ncbi:MBL fold metallo-hydrolase [Tumebacillus permanentifrigoris]|uniref:Glyoxylase-like metal-dependent hydrolase (Beta-lactamase superfamily II) n=1 Tax=Tumebacillus permanentifrigoris TaxID=378543 RepID=A0A316DFG2_9BACL|nr:MBL fold metallo-hydrolase [Tumebacillus permanentifrigoris]PWK14974.1 glyoxylase-like metal-dependent hydrolase (beta-lactamase superfamily II) [Tumebacillus permanentifrigoris]
MKCEQISEHIWSLKVWMVIPITVWVVVEADGVTLVDAGVPWMAKGILKFLEQVNAGPLKRILLTHGHFDHVGAVKAILQRYPVPVYAHGVEIPYLEGAVAYPRRKKAEQTLAAGIAQPLAEDAEGALEALESLQPYFTPGHSPGHVVFYHPQDEVLLTGDLFTSKRGKLNRPMPMFSSDMGEALRSSAIVEQLKPKRLEVCHGGPVFHPADHYEEYINTFSAKYATPSRVLK